jgi:DNA-binding NarL/FixJ family response regulator
MQHRTDLHWSGKAPRQGLLLAIGNDAALHRARAEALEQQWNVITATPDKAWQIFTENDCDLALVCQSVPAAQRQKLVWQISQRSPSTPILVISTEVRSGSVAPAISVDDNAEVLVETVQHHLDEQQRGRIRRKA